jgi:hypothetical protein
MHGTALMLSALLSLQEIGLVIEALALDYNAGQDSAIQAAIQLEISSNCRRQLADPGKRMEQTGVLRCGEDEACPIEQHAPRARGYCPSFDHVALTRGTGSKVLPPNVMDGQR